jgi:hypothetical protein
VSDIIIVLWDVALSSLVVGASISKEPIRWRWWHIRFLQSVGTKYHTRLSCDCSGFCSVVDKCHIPKHLNLDKEPWGHSISQSKFYMKTHWPSVPSTWFCWKRRECLWLVTSLCYLSHFHHYRMVAMQPVWWHMMFSLCLDILFYKSALEVLWVRSLAQQRQPLPLWILLLCPFLCWCRYCLWHFINKCLQKKKAYFLLS